MSLYFLLAAAAESLDAGFSFLTSKKFSKKKYLSTQTKVFKSKKIGKPRGLSLYHPNSMKDNNNINFYPVGSVWRGRTSIIQPKTLDRKPIGSRLSKDGETKVQLVIKDKNKIAHYSLQNTRKFDLNHLKALKAKDYVEKITV